MVGFYLAGVALLTLRLLIGVLRAAQIIRRAQTIDSLHASSACPRGTTIVASAEVVVPVTVGYRRPTIVLPADWKSWRESMLAAVLTHEGEHIRRRDTVVALLAAVACAVYWFHPVVWLIRRRLTELAEQICDDAVLHATGSRHEYAQNLLELADRLTSGSGRLRPVGVGMAREANVVKRIEAIIDNDRPLSQRIGAVRTLILLSISTPLVLLAAGLQPTARSAAADSASPAAKAQKSAESATEKPGEKTAKPQTSPADLKGRVVMAGDGKPVAGAEVRLSTSPANRSRTRTTTTDADGQFVFPQVEQRKTETRCLLSKLLFPYQVLFRLRGQGGRQYDRVGIAPGAVAPGEGAGESQRQTAGRRNCRADMVRR